MSLVHSSHKVKRDWLIMEMIKDHEKCVCVCVCMHFNFFSLFVLFSGKGLLWILFLRAGGWGCFGFFFEWQERGGVLSFFKMLWSLFWMTGEGCFLFSKAIAGQLVDSCDCCLSTLADSRVFNLGLIFLEILEKAVTVQRQRLRTRVWNRLKWAKGAQVQYTPPPVTHWGKVLSLPTCLRIGAGGVHR